MAAPVWLILWLFLVIAPILSAAVPSVAQNGGAQDFQNDALPQLLSHAVRRPLEEVCAALGAALPEAVVDSAVPQTCSSVSALFFVLARADEGVLVNIRFKLNSAVGSERQDLRALSDLVAGFHAELGWPLPAGFLAAITGGQVAGCRSGSLDYQFSQERGEVPRYNAIVRVVEPADAPVEGFVRVPPVCGR